MAPCVQEALAEAPPADAELVRACKAGAARCTLHAGDVRGGVALALRSGSKAVMRDCAAILRGGRGRGAGTSMEAAELYEAAGDAEEAVAVYLDAKALARVEPLMKHVNTPKLILAVRVPTHCGWPGLRHSCRRHCRGCMGGQGVWGCY